MKVKNTRLASLVSTLILGVSLPLSAWAAREVTVNPSWTREAIQQAIYTCDVVKFAPGDYPLGYTETAKYYRNSLLITKSVKLQAADARNKPCLYVLEGEEVRLFAVHAPLDATVVIQDLRIGAPWNEHIVSCGSFEITGCEPVPPNSTPGRLAESFGIWVAPMATMDTGEILSCEIGQFTAVGNRFSVGTPGGQVLYVDPAKFGNDKLKARFVLEDNSFSGTVPATILQYGSLKLLNNDFTCSGYLYDAFAIGFLVGCDGLDSSATLDHNRVFLQVPKPLQFDLGLEKQFVQVVTPFSLGSLFYGVGAHNVEVKNTEVCSAPEDFVLPYVVEVWDSHNCVIKGTTYTGLQVLPSGSDYDFFSEGIVALWGYGHDVPLGIGEQDAAEYMVFYSSAVSLIDNKNPEARVLEYPAPGGTRLLGRLRGMQD